MTVKSKLKKINPKKQKFMDVVKLLKSNKNQLSTMLRVCSDDHIQAVMNIVANLLYNKKIIKKIPPKKMQYLKNKMKSNQKNWINLTKNKQNVGRKRDFLLEQTGSGVMSKIGNILTPILSLIPLFL